MLWCFGVSLLRDRPGVFGVLVFRFCRQAWCFGVLVFRFCRQGWCFGVSVFRFLRVETPLRGECARVHPLVGDDPSQPDGGGPFGKGVPDLGRRPRGPLMGAAQREIC